MATKTASALSDEAKAVMRAHLANTPPGGYVASDDLTETLVAAGADRWERGEVWRWALHEGLIEQLSLPYFDLILYAFRPSSDPKAKGRRVAVYVRTTRPANRAA